MGARPWDFKTAPKAEEASNALVSTSTNLAILRDCNFNKANQAMYAY